MSKRTIKPIFFGTLLIASVACSGPPPGGDSGKGTAEAPARVTTGAEPGPTALPATAGGAAPTAGAANSPATAATPGTGNAPTARMPEPKVGSGGNDMFLFTKVRAAVAGAGELQGAGIVLNVSDGVVILSGSVPDETQKAKAAELARGVEGVKGVRNELRVAKGGGAR
ncbi:MAG TPA: BON domain-containing protein [Pyrinomonadaceae bacterium]|nr:BON domain-containing protein [Pyrinomonadaceae bacterium]